MVMLLLVVRACVCVWWVGLGGYLSVRTLLSHSVMIKALPGTPCRTHSHNQSTGQKLLSHAADTPHGSCRISHTHMHSYMHAFSFASFMPPIFNLFFLYTALRRLLRFPVKSSMCNVSPLVVSLSSAACTSLCYTWFFFPSASRAASQCLSLNSFLPHSLWDSLFETFLFSLFAFLFIEFHRFFLSNLWAFHSLFVLTSLFSCFWHLIDNSCCYFAAFLCCVILTLLFPTLFCMSALNKLCYHLLTPTLPIL